MDLLEIRQLAVTLGDKPILTNVDLTVEPGEIVGLLGPNGAGKSTTIAAALGLLPRRGGSVEIVGRDPRREPAAVYRDVGVLPEQNGFYDWMSADEYLAFFARLRGEHPDAERTAGRLAAVGLSPRRRQRIGTYSRGMRQRLGLARALIGEPRLVILDEPTNGLDPRGRLEIHALLRALAERGAGILLCTHLLDDVERLCRRVAIIADGRTLVEGRIDELTGASGNGNRFTLRLAAPPPDPATRTDIEVVETGGTWWSVRLTSGAAADTVWRDLLAAGWRIEEIRAETGGLEPLYLSLTESPERQAA